MAPCFSGYDTWSMRDGYSCCGSDVYITLHCAEIVSHDIHWVLQKRGNGLILDTMMESSGTFAYLATLLVAPFHWHVKLAAVKLLTTLSSTNIGKAAAVRPLFSTCNEMCFST